MQENFTKHCVCVRILPARVAGCNVDHLQVVVSAAAVAFKVEEGGRREHDTMTSSCLDVPRAVGMGFIVSGETPVVEVLGGRRRLQVSSAIKRTAAR